MPMSVYTTTAFNISEVQSWAFGFGELPPRGAPETPLHPEHSAQSQIGAFSVWQLLTDDPEGVPG